MSVLSLSGIGALPPLAMSSSLGSAAQSRLPQDDFSAVLKSFASETANAVRQGEAAAIAGVKGGLPLQDVVQQVLAAERTLQTALAVRDKAVGAYLEISRMQI